MIAPQTPERPARDGETCSCGRAAVTVSQTAKFGDVPFCGVEGGGHSGPRTPPPCPVEWCRDDHAKSVLTGVHASQDFINSPHQATVCIAQLSDGQPFVLLTSAAHAATLRLNARQTRALATLFDGDPGPAFHTGLAKALRKAADELDRITSGGGQ
jgi:hypothetical protein